MVHSVAIVAEEKSENSTSAARAARRAGRLPGVIYGSGGKAVSITLDPRDVMRGLNRAGFFKTLHTIEVGKTKELVLPKTIQYHPVNDQPMHIDFLRVNEKSKVAVDVPVRLINEGKCRGLKIGGILNVVRHNVRVACRATAIPDYFEIDLTPYKIGQAIKASTIPLPEGVTFTITDRDFNIATIAAPKGGLAAIDDDEDDAAPTEGDAASAA